MNESEHNSAAARFAGDTRYVELAQVVGFAPLLALTDSLRHAITICLLFVALQCLLLVIVRLVAPLVPRQVHLALTLISVALLTALTMQCMLRWQYALTQELGIYLPLLAVNAALYWNTLRGRAETTTIAALRGAAPGVLGMCAVTLLIALLRDALGAQFAALASPFGALILLSVLIAAIRTWQMRRQVEATTPS